MFHGWKGASRLQRTWPSRSGRGSVQSSPRECCGRYGCGRPTRTGSKSVIPSDTPPRRGLELRRRYSAAEVDVLTEDEAKRFAPGETGNPRSDITLAWELVYRLEPELYERLVAAERLHPGVLAWLPHDVERVVEVAAGTGRLALEVVARARGGVAGGAAAALR